jgi:long-chain acyl-CoA synthetase
VKVLVTGATGFLGGYVVGRLLEAGDEVVCLVRGDDPRERLEAALRPLVGDASLGGVDVAPGDLAAGPLDVDMTDVRAIVHCAADVRFDRSLDDARAINVEGPRRLIELARSAPHLERFVHVSTAYVGGTTTGRFGEDQLDVGQSFRNTYEQSKFEAEQLVRASGLPVRVVRPSIVVGESTTGWTSSFNVLYPPLRALARGLVERIPANPDAVVDVVPVDHVADVILTALRDPDAPETLHAVAGDAALRADELASAAAVVLGQPVPVLDPDDADMPPGGLDVYAPYFTVQMRFDATRARAMGLVPAKLRDYLPLLLGFADEARWGKRTLPRPPEPVLT